jgi:hypothetical protein
MNKPTFIVILLFISCFTLLAQAPDWVVKENDYQYSMTFVAKLNANGKQLISPNDKVAAFVGNSCRGVSGVTYVASEKNYYAYLTVFSNQQGESITFKLYDSSADKITTVSKPTIFVVNEHKGNLFQSYSIAEPALNHLADIQSFDFAETKSLSSIISNGIVKINISESYPVANLKPVFTLSKGANLLKNRVIQKSGEVNLNFSSPITYEVLSEDETTLSSYTVSVSQVIDPPLFYKKDAVCYARGAIKVISKREGASVQVTGNGKAAATRQIINGEALFTDLDAGSYIATIGSEWKIINITLKDK